MGKLKKPTKSQSRSQRTAQWVTFVVLFCFVMGSVVIGGLSFRSGQSIQIPPTKGSAAPRTSPKENPVHHWQEVVALNPKDPFALRNLARAWVNEGKFSEARKAAQDALLLSPADLLTLELQGQIAQKQGNIEEATGYFKKAVKRNPEDHMLLFELAQSLTVSGKHEEAAKYYERVIAIKPESPEGIRSRLALLNAAMYEKKFDEAKKQAFALYRMAPGDPRLLLRIGEIYEAQNQLPQALLYYERVRKAEPRDAYLSAHLAELYAKTGNESRASSLWLELIQNDKNAPEPKLRLALIDKKIGKKEEAKDLLERALKDVEKQKNDGLKSEILNALKGL